MKFTIERDALLSAMNRVSAIASRRSNIPILASVLVEATDSGLTFTATDLTIQSVIKVAAEVETPGRITVPAGSLADIAKSLADGAQVLCEMTDGRLHISGGRARWKLPTLGAENFPLMGGEMALAAGAGDEADTGWAWEHTVTGTMLADLVGRVSWAICTDQSRAFLAGVRLSVKEGELIGAATQGRDIAAARMAAPDGAPDFSGVTVSAPTCQEIVRAFGEAPDVTLRLSDSRIGIETADASMVSKVIGENYPDIPRMFSITHTDALTVDRRDFAAALRRAMIGADAATLGHGVRLSIEPGLMGVNGRSPHSEANDEVEIEYDGAATVIAVNAEAMMSALGCLKADAASIRFSASDAMTPLHVGCAGDDSVACLTCPQKVA